MKKRAFIYTVTGEVQIMARSANQSRTKIMDVLNGLLWTVDKPKAWLKTPKDEEKGPEYEI